MIESTDYKPTSHLLAPGRNCWRIEPARRAKLLIDGAQYFATLRQVMGAARESIFVIGWDIDSRIPLHPEEDDGLPLALGPFLNALVSRCSELNVYVLNWDFAMLYALDREFLPIYSLGWRTHRRLRFHMDDCHPPGASHHQKIVVVDDEVAFVGGIDLTKNRWDTSTHEAVNELRRNPDGEPYPPFHDAQMMLDGEAAAAVGELVRERWRRATGRIPAPRSASSPTRSIWPKGPAPDFENIGIGIARTEPAYGAREAVIEIRQSFLDCIAAARHSIFIENQYFTSPVVAHAIAQRLGEPDGPEVVVVSRYRGSGWLEQNTMYVLRARLIRRLLETAGTERLRFYYPHQAGLRDECIALHTKFMVVDDRILRVGSANLNNRSMGVDTECDVLIEASSDDDRAAIVRLRDTLLAEHLGVSEEDVAEAVARERSLIRGIESLRGGSRSLEPIPHNVDPELDALVPDSATIDPEQPVDPDRLVEGIVMRDERPRAGSRIVAITLLLVLFAALAAAWRWGPLHEWISPSALQAAAMSLDQAPATPLWVMLAYIIASLVAVPITLVVVATAFVFTPWLAVTYGILGSVLGAGITFCLGRALGRRLVRRLASSRLNQLSRRLGRGGVLAVLVFRLVPVAPFTIVNMVAGASHLRLQHFLIGTALGMAPGIVAVTIFTDRLRAALLDPSPYHVAVLAIVLAAIVLGATGIRGWLKRRKGSDRGSRTAR